MKSLSFPKITKKKLKKELTNLTGYLLGGGVWFWAGYILIVTLDGPLIEQFGESTGLFIANFIGNLVGFSLNYVVLHFFKFNSSKNVKLGGTTLRYYTYTIVNVFGLNYLILLGLKQVGIEPEISQFIASGFFTVWNYYWYKVYVFKDDGKGKKRGRVKKS